MINEIKGINRVIQLGKNLRRNCYIRVFYNTKTNTVESNIRHIMLDGDYSKFYNPDLCYIGDYYYPVTVEELLNDIKIRKAV